MKRYLAFLFVLSLSLILTGKIEATDIVGTWDVTTTADIKATIAGVPYPVDSQTQNFTILFSSNKKVTVSNFLSGSGADIHGTWNKKSNKIIIKLNKKDSINAGLNLSTLTSLGVEAKVTSLNQKWQITSYTDSLFNGDFSVQAKIKVTKVPAEFNQFKGKVVKIKMSGPLSGTKTSNKSAIKEGNVENGILTSIIEEVIKSR